MLFRSVFAPASCCPVVCLHALLVRRGRTTAAPWTLRPYARLGLGPRSRSRAPALLPASLVTAVRPTSNVLYCCAHTHSSPCCSLLIVSSSVRQKYARYNWNDQPADRPRDARGREGGCDSALQYARRRGACSGKRRMARCGARRASCCATPPCGVWLHWIRRCGEKCGS